MSHPTSLVEVLSFTFSVILLTRKNWQGWKHGGGKQGTQYQQVESEHQESLPASPPLNTFRLKTLVLRVSSSPLTLNLSARAVTCLTPCRLIPGLTLLLDRWQLPSLSSVSLTCACSLSLGLCHSSESCSRPFGSLAPSTRAHGHVPPLCGRVAWGGGSQNGGLLHGLIKGAHRELCTC